jgi:hypothetical protein
VGISPRVQGTSKPGRRIANPPQVNNLVNNLPHTAY